MQYPEFLYSEQPAIALFQQLGYQYYDGAQQDERNGINEVVLSARLRAAIKRINPWINDTNLQKAYDAITRVHAASLMETNQDIWNLIRGASFSVQQIIDGEEHFKSVCFIDYQHPENNDFLVVNQMKFKGLAQHSVPDLVVFINGLPIAVIECKSPSAGNAWDKAYSDLVYYQENSEKLFHYNQLCVGIWDTGGKYGAIQSPKQFYSVFKTSKEDDLSALGSNPLKQSILLYALFQKERLLDIVRHFVLFELTEGTTIKKLPRYQQWRATNKTIAKLQTGEGGVVWHTQGSGKSLTMAYVARKLQAPEYGFNNPTILVMTDRKDLDRQITTTFRNVGFKNVHQASSVVHLDKLLRNDYGGIITTTLQKFQETDKTSEAQQDQTELEESGTYRIEKNITANILTKITSQKIDGKWVEVKQEEITLEELSQKENLFIMVDEAHRSQYGFLASFMRTALPHAKFIAFTGTPISKEDKSTLGEFYGGDYIDVYTIREAVEDGATVKLLYDEGIARMDIRKKELDKEFQDKFGKESEEKKDKLKREALRKYKLSKDRIEAISKHIINHYIDKIYANGHKALLVCDGREQAIKYQQAFYKLKEAGVHDFESKVVISLGSAKTDDIAKEYYKTVRWNAENPTAQKPLWVVPTEEIKAVTDYFKLPFGDESETEKSGKRRFDNTAFLIVSDMLLTGYDAPVASCLYLDKSLKEHNLLQAIARVNRSRKGKDAGYIMDYSGIAANLIEALEIFSGDLRPDDILKNLSEELPKLSLNHTKLVDFFRPLRIDRKYNRSGYIYAVLNFIEPIDKRDTFKTLLKEFNKSLSIVLPNEKAMPYQYDFKLFNEIKVRARNTYPEDEEFKVSKNDSQLLQGIIDDHLSAEGVDNLLAEPVSILTPEFEEEIAKASPTTKELTMRNNLKYTIKVGVDRNPDFYKPLAERLEQLIELQKLERISETQLLLEYANLLEEISGEEKEGEALGFTTKGALAIFSSMKVLFNGDAQDATKTILDLVAGELNIIGWETKAKVQKDMKNKITRFLKTKLSREEAKIKANELVEVLKKNKDA